jgi:hypothetical protein
MVTIESLKKTIAALGYKWFEDQPNIIAVRTNLQVPDVFNDLLFIVYKKAGIETLYSATITTEPGIYYQKHLLNPKGCWVMMPNQMINSYKSGFHQNKPDHRCLQSLGKIYGLREDDKDGIIGNDKDAVASWQDGNQIGANIHGAIKNTTTTTVDKWSAGCQVHSSWTKKEEMMDIVDSYKKVNNGWITYTLIKESDLINLNKVVLSSSEKLISK